MITLYHYFYTMQKTNNTKQHQKWWNWILVICMIALIVSMVFIFNPNILSDIKNKTDKTITMDVNYNINDDITTDEKLSISIKQKNIKKLTINWNKIDLDNDNLSYSYPLELWVNKIIIIWENEKEQKEESITIERITLEQQEQLKQMEEENKIALKLDTINNSIEDLEDFIWKYDTILNIFASIWTLDWYWKITKDYLENENQEIRTLAETLKEKLIEKQIEEFPKFRKAYWELMNEKLWVENMKVRTSENPSTGNRTISYVSVLYYNNQNIQDSIDWVKEELGLLRFNKVNFEKSEYDTSKTYTLKVKNDDEL